MKLLDVDKSTGTVLDHQTKEHHLLKGLSNALLQLLNSDDTKAALKSAFSMLLKVIDADAVYLMEFSRKKSGKLGITYVYIFDELLKSKPQILSNNYVEVVYDNTIHEENFNKFGNREIVFAKAKDFVRYGEKLNNIFLAAKMKGFSLLPIMVDEQLWGGLSFINRTEREHWNESEEQVLTLFAQSLGNFLARKEAEKSLQESEQRLDMIIEGANLGTWIWEIPSNHIHFNDHWAKMLGYDPKELKPVLETFVSLIHPDDTAAVWQKINDHMAGKLDFFEVELRMKAKNGEWRWILDRGRIVEWNENGLPLRAYGTHIDITEKKISEIKLRESEALFRSMYENSPLGIAYTDIKGFIMQANDKYCELLGYSREELVGMDFRDFTHPEDSAWQTKVTFKNYEENKHAFQFEKRYIRKDGNIVWANVATAYLHDEKGKFQSVITIVEDITEKKKKLDALVERESLLSSLFENSSLGIIIKNSERKVIRVNRRLCEMLEYTEPEFLKLRRMEYMTAETAELGLRLLAEAIEKKGNYVSAEGQFYKKDGSTLWVNISVSIIYDEEGKVANLVTMAEDITVRFETLDALKKSEALQKATLNALPDLKLRIRECGRILEYYPSREEEGSALLPPASCVGGTLTDVYPEFIAKGVLFNARQAIKTNEVRSFEYVIPLKDDLAYFETRISAINDQEVIAMIRNISDRKKMQQSLQEKIRELDINNKELQKYIDSNMELENFAYVASHDLREPVRTMRTFAQLLKKKHGHKLEESAKNYIDFIVDGSNNMNQLIEDLLTYSRVNTDKHFIEPIHLKDLIKEILDGLGDIIHHSGVDIMADHLPEVIMANPTKLKQLFQNLISNAIKFHKEGQTPQVEISAEDIGAYWQFSVTDNGIGIDPEFHDRIFLLFKKLHSKREYQGTGLGLAICKKIVEQHHGNIWVESIPGEGATFSFTIQKQPNEV